MTVSSTKLARTAPIPVSYWDRSRQPLYILAFLLPLIIVYEVGVVLLRGDLSNVAHLTLLRFFDAMSVPAVSGLYMGGVLIVVVLLTWHILASHRWSIEWPVIGTMTIESFVLSIPLVVVAYIIASAAHMPAAGASVSFADLSTAEKLVVSLGAGLYEELLFRMVLIGVLHTLLVDVAGASNRLGCAIAIIVSAVAFAWYHTIGRIDPVPVHNLVFWFVAGLYFGTLFLWRGFGIVVAVHAIYDLIVLISIRGD